MSCEKYASLLQDYLDQELDPQSIKQVIKHYHACCGCKEKLEQIRCMKELLRTKHQYPSAPVGLTQQIRYKILHTRKNTPVQSLPRKPKKVGVLFTFVLLISLTFWLFLGQNPKDVNVQIIQDHHRVQSAHDLSPDPIWQIGTNDPRKLENWFEAQYHKKISIPHFENTQITLECGGSCQFLGEPVLLACYKYNASKMTLFIISKNNFARHTQEDWYQEYSKGPCKIACCQGYQVLYWQREEWVYALVVEPYFLAQFEEIQNWVNKELL